VIEKSQPWERPAGGPADAKVTGDDAALARAVLEHPGARLRFVPSARSDLARALALSLEPGDEEPRALELPLDAMRVTCDAHEHLAVNMVVVGVAPDRARWLTRDLGVLVTVDDRVVHDARAVAVVIASGQFLRGLDLVPRGHPGDGRLEVQVYAATRRERAAVRARLRQGAHLPHPRIGQTSGRRVAIRADRGLIGVEIDGRPVPEAATVVVEVVSGAFSLLV
jgi:diacylglycerol kinase family enzyme